MSKFPIYLGQIIQGLKRSAALPVIILAATGGPLPLVAIEAIEAEVTTEVFAAAAAAATAAAAVF